MVDVRFLHAKEGVAGFAFKISRLRSMKVSRGGELVNVLICDEMVDQFLFTSKVNVTISADGNL